MFLAIGPLVLILLVPTAFASPIANSPGHPKRYEDPIPGESPLFTSYTGSATPLQSKYNRVIPATCQGSPGPDDVLFQNLLSAEWIIYSFYQYGVDTFSAEDFTALRLPNTTYERIIQIRDNEAGHVRIFQDNISNKSVKPGPCKYDYGVNRDPETYLALQVLLEISSMAFLTGLVQEARLNSTKGALVAIAETESRHNSWALTDIWNANPFAGPSDTIYPYATHILASTNSFIIPGSCPSQNPVYPFPSPDLPPLDFQRNASTSAGTPGSSIQFTFPDAGNQPHFDGDKEYFTVFFHGVNNITMPFDVKRHTSTVPGTFDTQAGLILAVISTEPGAVTEASVVAGPLILLQQPANLTRLV